MAAAEQRFEVVASYSHADAAWPKRAQVHLKPLVRDEQIDLWGRYRHPGRCTLADEIGAALARVRGAVLLISVDLLQLRLHRDERAAPATRSRA